MHGLWKFAVAALAVGLAGTASAADPVKVGVLLPLSGSSAISGQEILLGIKLAAEEVNAKGGVIGRPIELVIEDDEGSPTKGTSAVHKEIEGDNVCAIVGTYNSDVALAEARIAREHKIPMSSGGSTSVAVTDANTPGDPWFFRAFPGSDEQGEQSALDVVKRLGAKNLAIIADNSSYGQSLADQFKKVTTAAGAKMLVVENYNAGEQDFYAMLSRVKAMQPDAIYIAGLLTEGAAIIRQSGEINFKPRFVGSGSMMSDKFTELAGPASEGFAVSSMFEPNTPNAYGRAFNERFVKRWGHNANVFSALGFDSAAIVFEAIKRAGKPDGLAIRDAMVAMKDAPLVQGPEGTMVNYDNKGGAHFKIGLAVVKNGQRQLMPFD
jgi:branched-chain amino acid transport system substrate-binding protein